MENIMLHCNCSKNENQWSLSWHIEETVTGNLDMAVLQGPNETTKGLSALNTWRCSRKNSKDHNMLFLILKAHFHTLHKTNIVSHGFIQSTAFKSEFRLTDS